MLRINDLNGCFDLNMNGSEVEGGVFTEEIVTSYPLLDTKRNSLRGTIGGEGLPVGPALRGSFLKTCLNGRFSSLHRKLFREEQEGGVPGPPSYYTRRGDGIQVPALHKFMQGYKNLLKLNIPFKTISNIFPVMNRQIWTNQGVCLVGPRNSLSCQCLAGC